MTYNSLQSFRGFVPFIFNECGFTASTGISCATWNGSERAGEVYGT